ncbi:glycerol kinase, partial [Pasteurella multocida subsp. multocida str. Anand1_cattle]
PDRGKRNTLYFHPGYRPNPGWAFWWLDFTLNSSAKTYLVIANNSRSFKQRKNMMTDKKYIIALDQGTTSSRAVLLDHDANI